MPEPSFSADEWVTCAATLIGLPIAPEYRAGVVANFERIQDVAQLVLDFPLPETIETAPTFNPQSSHHRLDVPLS